MLESVLGRRLDAKNGQLFATLSFNLVAPDYESLNLEVKWRECESRIEGKLYFRGARHDQDFSFPLSFQYPSHCPREFSVRPE